MTTTWTDTNRRIAVAIIVERLEAFQQIIVRPKGEESSHFMRRRSNRSEEFHPTATPASMEFFLKVIGENARMMGVTRADLTRHQIPRSLIRALCLS